MSEVGALPDEAKQQFCALAAAQKVHYNAVSVWLPESCTQTLSYTQIRRESAKPRPSGVKSMIGQVLRQTELDLEKDRLMPPPLYDKTHLGILANEWESPA